MEDVKQEIKGTSVDAAGGTAFARIIIIFLSSSGSGGRALVQCGRDTARRGRDCGKRTGREIRREEKEEEKI